MLSTIEEFIRLDLAICMAKTSAARKAAKAEMLSEAYSFGRSIDEQYIMLTEEGTPLQKEVFATYFVVWAHALSNAITLSLKGNHKAAQKMLVDLSDSVRFAE